MKADGLSPKKQKLTIKKEPENEMNDFDVKDIEIGTLKPKKSPRKKILTPKKSESNERNSENFLDVNVILETKKIVEPASKRKITPKKIKAITVTDTEENEMDDDNFKAKASIVKSETAPKKINTRNVTSKQKTESKTKANKESLAVESALAASDGKRKVSPKKSKQNTEETIDSDSNNFDIMSAKVARVARSKTQNLGVDTMASTCPKLDKSPVKRKSPRIIVTNNEGSEESNGSKKTRSAKK